MFKVISTKRYKELTTLAQLSEETTAQNKEILDELTSVTEENKKLTELQTELSNSFTEAMDELNEKLKVAQEDLEETRNALAKENSVKLLVSNDLIHVTPIIRYNPVIIEKLIELKYLDDTIDYRKDGGKMAVQLALLTIAKDATMQILDSFSEDFVELDDN